MSRTRVVIAGNGMVGHKLIEELLERDGGAGVEIIVFAEEDRVAYDRVGLSSYMSGATTEDLKLMRECSPPWVQVKAAGGVRTYERLVEVRALGVTRVGATATKAILDGKGFKLGLFSANCSSGPAVTKPSFQLCRHRRANHDHAQSRQPRKPGRASRSWPDGV